MDRLSKYLTLMILFCVVVSVPCFSELDECLDNNTVTSSSDTIESESLGLILIYNDQNFTDYGFSGLGTALDPYIIENYVFDTFNYGVGILVEDTTKHFIIRNCSIKALWTCIYIRDVADYTATITNNTCYTIYNHQTASGGIAVSRTNGAEITNNFCEYEQVTHLDEYGDSGIFLYSTNNTLIENNTCLNQSENGIFSIDSENNTFCNNVCSFNFWGIMVVGARAATIKGNIINNNIEGIEIIYAEVVIDDNVIGFNERDGIMIYSVYDSEIISNTIEFNGWYGIRSWDTHRCRMTYNLIRNNTEYGVALDENSRLNSIHHNYFVHNNIEGSSQAYDSGKDNTWFDEDTLEGNYWSDCEQNSTYHINGKTENNDLYPLNENLERPTTTKLHFHVTMVFLGVIFLYLNNRKKMKI